MVWHLRSQLNRPSPMKSHPEHLSRGQKAEAYALNYLQQKGLKLVTRNYRWRGGEIDLVLRDGCALVFVEVRLRSNPRYGGALASIDPGKQRRLIQSAQHYLCHHAVDSATRFDVVALTPAGKEFEVNWIRDAFQATP